MDVKLVLHKRNGQAQICHLHRDQTLVGRRRECDLRILSLGVSRRHCLLNTYDGYVTVQDLASVNGTFINDQRVIGEQIVWPGDRLGIASVAFFVEYVVSPSVRKQLEQRARKRGRGHARVEESPQRGNRGQKLDDGFGFSYSLGSEDSRIPRKGVASIAPP
jgi:pSer/pThr/pTyr-binding forkhead associated (FHA) protein